MAGVSTSIEGSGERCPTCQAPLAADQRYCLECGNRRGDPRLPFMDAVVFMDAVKSKAEPPPPPPPPERKPQGISANTALIAGIATLVLAIGVGVLIGRSGNNGNATAAAPQVIKVGGSEGGEEEETTTPKEESTGKKHKKSGSGGKKKEASASQVNEEAEEASNEVLKPKVPVVKSGTQLGEKCDPSAAGCSKNGKFEGEFFGE